MRGILLSTGMLLYRARYWWPVERMARRPEVTQLDVLLKVLSANRGTRFGIEHGFDGIRDARGFQEHVPVQTYDTLSPYIDEQRRTGARALTHETPLFYAQTSGTSGAPKHIPVTPSMFALHRAEQALFSYLQFRACPAAFKGKALGIVGAAVEGYLDSGHPVGSVSGRLYETLPGPIRAGFVVPAAVSSIQDYDLKYLVIVRLALAEPDITWLGSPNPSTFLRLLDILKDHREPLLDSLKTGKFDAMDALDEPLRRAIARRLKPDPDRAERLSAESALTFASVWPGIRLVSTWTGGSCGIALERLRTKLPPAALVMELGYQSTEFRGTMALNAETPGGLPPLHHHFFEFVEPAGWDSGNPEFLTLDRLEPNKTYYVLITTASGLYRYFMNDLIEVTGFFDRTPLLRFLQKGKGVTSLTGEKLYEAQAIEAVRGILSRNGLVSSFFLLVADEEISGYHLYVELDAASQPDTIAIAVAIDDRLGELNMEYHSKRASARLGPLTLAWIKRGTAEAYKAACVRAGQREGQFKPTVLQYRKDLILSLRDYVME